MPSPSQALGGDIEIGTADGPSFGHELAPPDVDHLTVNGRPHALSGGGDEVGGGGERAGSAARHSPMGVTSGAGDPAM
ncbi:MAG: hypothetical protein M3O23_09410 [Actinomycetota bacterium]|nr:hypothetical protein [Actinomycetota bacterium]